VSHPSAPAAPAPAPQPGGFAASLVGQIQGRQIGEGTTRIELAPRGLGGIEIDLAQDDLGALRVTIRAENPAVLHALRDNREALLAMLRDSGVSVDSGSLGFDDMARGEGQSHRSQGNGEAVIMSAELEGDDPAQPQAAPAADLGPGRVDMTT
jgi:flagellar hook-length control protein FliK